MIGLISVFLIGFVIAVAYLYMRNKKLERYAVPMLDEHEQIEPRVPEYSDDSDDQQASSSNKFGSRAKQEMVTISTSIGSKFKAKMNERKQTKKRQGRGERISIKRKWIIILMMMMILWLQMEAMTLILMMILIKLINL